MDCNIIILICQIKIKIIDIWKKSLFANCTNMALFIGHSQEEYLSDYLDKAYLSVFSYPGYGTLNCLREDNLFDVAPFFSVSKFFYSFLYILYCPQYVTNTYSVRGFPS